MFKKIMHRLNRILMSVFSHTDSVPFTQDKMVIAPLIQPICNSLTGEVIGAEILIRMHDGDKDYTSDAMLTYITKDDGLDNVMSQVMRHVAHNLSDTLQNAPEGFYLSFNVYAPQLYSSKVIEAISLLRRSFSPRINIVVEIIESSLPIYDQYIVDVMDHLRNQGVMFAIDGFGKSSSSLLYLENAGFGFLKMDRSILLTHDGKLVYQRLINSLVTVSKELDMHLVAEGVENTAQKELLQKSGVCTMQGYYFSAPRPLWDFNLKNA